MSMHLQQEIENLKSKLLALVATAKGAVEMAVKSVDERDAEDPVSIPTFVGLTGLPRAGSTLLCQLLASPEVSVTQKTNQQ